MGYVDVAGAGFVLPDGRELFADVSFRVGEGQKVALVGPNGAGKTTLMRMVAGDIPTQSGTIARAGGLGVMRQFIGMIGDDRTLEDLALSLVSPALREAGERATAPTLDRIRQLLGLLGDPERQYPIIHVTGTNGKTSTSRAISRILAAHDLSVGTYTSPHLHSVTERLLWNGEPIANG